MSREVFEYFFEPEELEPFYSELVRLPKKGNSTPDVRPLSRPTEVFSEREQTEPSQGGEVNARLKEPESEFEETKPKEAVKDSGKPAAASALTESARSPSSEAPSVERTRVRQLLSVHALGQYVFCARSAILAAERGDEHDVDEPLPRLTYLPNFDLERIEEMLSKKLRHLAFAFLYGVSMVCLMAAGVLSQNRSLFYPALFVFVACLSWFVSLLVTICRLAKRRRDAINAESREIDPQITSVQSVNWWSMLNAGFEPVNYDRPFRHPELPLEGCPWRVLERHSQRIPVIRSGGKKLGDKNGEMYPKHQVRLAAYALLLETAEHVEVPYGLIFPLDSTRGLAMPITDALREWTLALLAEFAHKLRESQQQGSEPRPPENRKRCQNCRHGYPVLLKAAEISSARKAGKKMVILEGQNGRTYHCDCGDRFGTPPPHGQSIKLGLKACLD